MDTKWREVSPGRYERPLDAQDRTHQCVSLVGKEFDKEPWVICVTIQCEFSGTGSQLEKSLRRAWLSMRYEHPTLAASIEHDRLIYQVPSESEAKQWVEDTLQIVADQTATNFFPLVPRRPQVTLYFFPETSELMLVSSHFRMDGRGAILALDSFLRILTAPEESISFGDEHKNLSVHLAVACGLPAMTPKAKDRAEDLGKRRISTFPSLGLACITPEAPPLRTLQVLRVLDEPTSKSVIEWCKRHNITVTSCIQAALILALREFAPDHLKDRAFTGFGLFDLRHHCQPPYNSPKAAVCPLYSAMPMNINPSSSSFLTVARSCQEFYHTTFRDDNVEDLMQIEPFLSSILPLLATPWHPEAPVVPTLSSLGVVDGFIQHTYKEEGGDAQIRVHDFSMSMQQANPFMHIFLWTFNGKMQLNATFNEAYHDRDVIEKVLDQTLELTLRQCRSEDSMRD